MWRCLLAAVTNVEMAAKIMINYVKMDLMIKNLSRSRARELRFVV